MFNKNSSNGQSIGCWHCLHSQVHDNYCEACQTYQDAESESFFTLLSLPVGYSLDKALLEQQYLKLQQRFHPDKFTRRSREDQLKSLSYSTLINEAYATLTSPVKRAEYLLHLQGIWMDGDELAIKPDQAMLLQMMEWREELHDAKDVKQVQSIISTLKQLEKETEVLLAQSFESKDWSKAGQQTLLLQYINKTLQDARKNMLQFI